MGQQARRSCKQAGARSKSFPARTLTAKHFPIRPACAQLPHVSESSELHLLRASPRMVAAAKLVHGLPKAAVSDLRPGRGWPHPHAAPRGGGGGERAVASGG